MNLSPPPTAETPETTEASQPAAETGLAVTDDIAPIIDQLIAEVPARVGIAIEDRSGSVIYEHAPDDLFEAASLYKLAIMVEIYHAREAGLLSFDDEIMLEPAYFVEGDDVYVYDLDVGSAVLIGDALRSMITASSNVAAAALLHTVGSTQVNEFMRSLGLTSTEIRWDPFFYYDSQHRSDETFEDPALGEDPEIDTDEESTNSIGRSREAAVYVTTRADSKADFARSTAMIQRQTPLGLQRIAHQPANYDFSTASALEDAYNVTTPRDMARFFQLLLAGGIVSPDASEEMLELLAQQLINDRLPAWLPDDTRVAHKTGNLPGTVHDAGVIFTDNGPAVVVVMSDQAEDEETVNSLIRETASIVYTAMSQ